MGPSNALRTLSGMRLTQKRMACICVSLGNWLMAMPSCDATWFANARRSVAMALHPPPTKGWLLYALNTFAMSVVRYSFFSASCRMADLITSSVRSDAKRGASRPSAALVSCARARYSPATQASAKRVFRGAGASLSNSRLRASAPNVSRSVRASCGVVGYVTCTALGGACIITVWTKIGGGDGLLVGGGVLRVAPIPVSARASSRGSALGGGVPRSAPIPVSARTSSRGSAGDSSPPSPCVSREPPRSAPSPRSMETKRMSGAPVAGGSHSNPPAAAEAARGGECVPVAVPLAAGAGTVRGSVSADPAASGSILYSCLALERPSPRCSCCCGVAPWFLALQRAVRVAGEPPPQPHLVRVSIWGARPPRWAWNAFLAQPHVIRPWLPANGRRRADHAVPGGQGARLLAAGELASLAIPFLTSTPGWRPFMGTFGLGSCGGTPVGSPPAGGRASRPVRRSCGGGGVRLRHEHRAAARPPHPGWSPPAWWAAARVAKATALRCYSTALSVPFAGDARQ